MKKLIVVLMGLGLCGSLSAQTAVTPSTEAGEENARQERIKWWRDGKFGMFIHWGLYFGKPRNAANPTPGPFEAPGTGTLTMKVWPLASTREK